MSEITLNDRVTKVMAFKYSPDRETADLFLDELSLQVYLDRIYIRKLEDMSERSVAHIKQLEDKIDLYMEAFNKLYDKWENLLCQLADC